MGVRRRQALMFALTAQQAMEVDRRTIQEVGLPGLVLMENAGRAVVRLIETAFATHLGRGVAVVVGRGNNGGDGLVVARTLASRGVAVRVVSLGTRTQARGDAAVQWSLLQHVAADQVEVIEVDAAVDLARAAAAISQAGVCVDALFGTGLERPIEGLAARVVALLNDATAPVIAVDIASGVHGSTGHVLGCAVRAAVTVCAGALKRGALIHPGAAHCGRLHVAEIGFPPSLIESVCDGVEVTTPTVIGSWLPARELSAHKRSVGRVSIVAGAAGMAGAAVIVTRAALRAGAGLATLAHPRSIGGFPEGLLPEALTRRVEDEGEGAFGASSLKGLVEAISGADAVAVGPGVGRSPATLQVLAALIDIVEVPMVVDADGLRALPLASTSRPDRVLTPHANEMAVLMGEAVEAVVRGPVEVARACAQRHGCVVVLKGHRTVVAAPDGRVRINVTGNPGMASGGMGDALTGVIASLLAQGVASFEAAVAGVFAHGHAGDRLAARRARVGWLASDVADEMPHAFDDIRTRPLELRAVTMI